MKVHKKSSVVPIYLLGLTWLVYALLFPLHAPVHFGICAVVSLVVFAAGKALFPDQVYQLPGEEQEAAGDEPKQEKKPEAEPADPQIAALKEERDRALSEMRRLNDAIQDETISRQIDHLEEVTGKILDQVIAQPRKQPQIRRFLDYYLPTTLKILNAYDRMSAAGIAGDNIDATKDKVEKMMDTIVKAFDKQLDALFGEEALDISTDITVMENLLAQEGLSGPERPKTSGEGTTLEL